MMPFSPFILAIVPISALNSPAVDGVGGGGGAGSGWGWRAATVSTGFGWQFVVGRASGMGTATAMLCVTHLWRCAG